MEITVKDYDEYATIKVTKASYCDSCSEDFEPMSIVYFAPIDNTIICKQCSKSHTEIKTRLFTEPY